MTYLELLTPTLAGRPLADVFLNDATCIADNGPIFRDFVNLFCSFKFCEDQILEISEILTKKRNYDFRKTIILICDLMPDCSALNFRAYRYFISDICQVVLRKFQFYEIVDECLRQHYFGDDSSK